MFRQGKSAFNILPSYLSVSDRIRSTSNTMTILVGAVILDRICKSSLSVPTNQQEETLNEPEPEVIVHINKEKDSTKEEKPLLMT